VRQVEAEVAAMVAEAAKAVSTRGLRAADCAVDPTLMDRYLDLALLASPCPHVVQVRLLGEGSVGSHAHGSLSGPGSTRLAMSSRGAGETPG
jgi:hypothetical protein